MAEKTFVEPVVEIAGKSSQAKKPAPAKPAAKKLPRETLAGMVASTNFVVGISGYGAYALTSDEIDALADALYDVIAQYPGAMQFLIEGGKISPWVKLAIVAGPIAYKRFEIYSAKQPAKGPAVPTEEMSDAVATADAITRATRSFDWNDRLGEDGSSPIISE